MSSATSKTRTMNILSYHFGSRLGMLPFTLVYLMECNVGPFFATMTSRVSTVMKLDSVCVGVIGLSQHLRMANGALSLQTI